MRRILLRSVAAAALLAPVAAAAQSETTASANLSLDGGYSTRPSGQSLGGATAFARFGVEPRVKIRSSRTTVDLSGEAEVYQYIRYNHHDENYAAQAALTNQFSASTTGNLNLDFTDRALNRFGNLQGDLVLGNNGDAALLGTGARRRHFGANAGLSSRLNARSTLTGSGGWMRSRYAGVTGGTRVSNYDNYNASLGYSLIASERVTIGAHATYLHADYANSTFPDSSSYGGAATFKVRLDAHWTLDAQLGATLRDLALAAAKDQVFLTGSASLCQQGERSNLCVHASRSVGSSGFAGSSIQTNVGANFSLRLSEKGTINADASYVRSDRSTTAVASHGYLMGTLGYDRQLSQRLKLTTTAFYRKSTGALAIGEDYGGRVGFMYRVGDTQ